MSVRTNDLSPSVCLPIRKHGASLEPWHHWDYFIIVSHLTWRSFPSLYPLKLNSGVILTACFLANQNTLGKQLFGLYTLQYCSDQACPCQMRRLHISVCTFTCTLQKPPHSYCTYQSGGSFMFLLNQTGRQTSHFRRHHSCPELQSWVSGRRSVKCGENRGSCGKHVSTGQL